MKPVMYTFDANPTGQFASQLEKKWHEHFLSRGWRCFYIGDKCNWTDFETSDGIKIEIKPFTADKRFIRSAALRAKGEILIAAGEPGFCNWYYGKPDGNAAYIVFIDMPLIPKNMINYGRKLLAAHQEDQSK